MINFSLGNTFEAKMRDKDSTKTEAKKVKLLNLNFTSGYDITKDSLRFLPVSMNGGTVLFNQKLTINFGANLNPYAVDQNGRLINKFNITNHGSLFRMTNANVSMNYSISSKELRGEKPKTKKSSTAQSQFGNPNDVNSIQESLFTKEDEEENDKKEKPKFYHSKIDWTLGFNYSFVYSNDRRLEEIRTHSIAINATIDLTQKWKISGNTGYDIIAKTITYPRVAIERDLLSWRMNFNWVPAGTYTSWGFFIGIKSSALSDIKWDKQKQPDRRL